jgi:hypothetical protein
MPCPDGDLDIAVGCASRYGSDFESNRTLRVALLRNDGSGFTYSALPGVDGLGPSVLEHGDLDGASGIVLF